MSFCSLLLVYCVTKEYALLVKYCLLHVRRSFTMKSFKVYQVLYKEPLQVTV